MKTISLCMIVKNEEALLENCLKDVQPVVDEIIIVDTGSTDRSIEIAKKFTDKIYHFDWVDDFSAAYNFSESKATCDYIMSWDADFLLEKGSAEKIQKLKNNDFDDADVVYCSWYVEIGDDGKPVKTLGRHVFFRRELFHWELPVHKQLVLNDNSMKIKEIYQYNIGLFHLKDKEVKQFRYKQTRQILQKVVQLQPNNYRLVFNYAESLFFDEEYGESEKIFKNYLDNFLKADLQKSIFAVEKLMQIYLKTNKADEALAVVKKYKELFDKFPRYKITYADAVASVELMKSQKYFEEYLKRPVLKDQDPYLFDYERYVIHPRMMLGFIYTNSGEIHRAKKMFEFVIENTHSKVSLEKAEKLLLELNNYGNESTDKKDFEESRAG